MFRIQVPNMNRQPIRRVLLVVAIVSLVAIAGCNGLSGSSTPGNTTTDTSAGGTPTPADGSTPTPDVASDEDSDVTDSVDATNISENETDDSDQTTNGSDQTTDESDGDTDDSAPAGADINGTALTEGTAAVVEDAGSYTITSRLSQASQRSATVLNTTARVDFDARQGTRTTNLTVTGASFLENTTTVVYTADNTSYQRQANSSDVTYTVQQGGPQTQSAGISPVNVTQFNTTFSRLADSYVWTENGTQTIDGVETTRYTLLRIDQSGTQSSGQVTEARGTLFVDDDDAVRAFETTTIVEGRAGTTRTTRTVRVTDIGSTTVEEPDWTSQANGSDGS